MSDSLEQENIEEVKLDLPLLFTAHYECECGEAYELENCYIPRIHLPCDTCDTLTYFYVRWVEHKHWVVQR